jgi:hypothetical protein
LTLLACRWFFILEVETKDFDAGFLAKSGMQEHLYGHRDVIFCGYADWETSAQQFCMKESEW